MDDTALFGEDQDALAGPVFLVLESDILVAEDIIATLKEMGPCRATHLVQPDEIMEILLDGQPVTAAFLQMRLGDVAQSAFLQPLLERGARIILTMGEEDEDSATAQGYRMLVRPFTDLMIRDILVDRA
ncbi:MAG: hypothetical protein R3D85_06425 [Paracoccaceae bacterium]